MDNLGNLLSQNSPDTGTTQSTYDEAGNLKTRTDARGKTATYSYDAQNRVTQVVYDDQTVTYTWDSCTNGIGRLCNLANGTSTLAFNYDSHGRITNKSQTIGTISKTLPTATIRRASWCKSPHRAATPSAMVGKMTVSFRSPSTARP